MLLNLKSIPEIKKTKIKVEFEKMEWKPVNQQKNIGKIGRGEDANQKPEPWLVTHLFTQHGLA